MNDMVTNDDLAQTAARDAALEEYPDQTFIGTTIYRKVISMDTPATPTDDRWYIDVELADRSILYRVWRESGTFHTLKVKEA